MRLKKIIKTVISFILNLIFLDRLVCFFSRCTYTFSKLLYYKDWVFWTNKQPLYFKHYINLGYWRFNPGKWTFTARGVYARESMNPGCSVLDICCGDGTHAYLFYSDIAGKIDAVDNDISALNYAYRYNRRPNINYLKTDIISEQFPSSEYDVIVWNAGICYFTIDEILIILEKIVKAGNKTMVFHGMLPKANAHLDHLTEFENEKELIGLLEKFFLFVSMKTIIEDKENKNSSFYFRASNI